jgi:micrococcal nuclease
VRNDPNASSVPRRRALRLGAVAAAFGLSLAGLAFTSACATESPAARPPATDGPGAGPRPPAAAATGGPEQGTTAPEPGGPAPGSAAPPVGRGEGPAGRRPAAALWLDGERVEVRWIDGDSLRIRSGAHRGRIVRLQGYNTLESYGPVHRWGAWTPLELLAIARASTAAAAAGEWRCTTRGAEDRYQRLLLACPDAAEALARQGLAMAYAIGGPAETRTLSAQEEARRAGAGMWAKGAPGRVVTSLHSADEAEGGVGEVYDRVLEVATGRAREVRHALRYRTCEEVCHGEGPDLTCMTYVPFASRYRDRPPCLRGAAR